MRQTPSERERHASEIRQRLQELHQSLGIRFPVYVLFTKCDLFAGFVEFFGDLNREQLAQVWGVTFPVTEDPASSTAIADFAGEFDALEKRLNGRILMRVQQERDFHRRALIYSFPRVQCDARCGLELPESSVRNQPLRGTRDAARRLLHQRHAGGERRWTA